MTKAAVNPYDSIISGMTGHSNPNKTGSRDMNGSINCGLDNSDEEDALAEKYQHEDMFKPYN